MRSARPLPTLTPAAHSFGIFGAFLLDSAGPESAAFLMQPISMHALLYKEMSLFVSGIDILAAGFLR